MSCSQILLLKNHSVAVESSFRKIIENLPLFSYFSHGWHSAIFQYFVLIFQHDKLSVYGTRLGFIDHLKIFEKLLNKFSNM